MQKGELPVGGNAALAALLRPTVIFAPGTPDWRGYTMQQTFFRRMIAAAAILAVLITGACSSAEPAPAEPNAPLQAQSVPTEPAPTPTATLITEIIEEPVSPVSPLAPPAESALGAAEQDPIMELPDNLPPGSEQAVQAAINDLSQQQGIAPNAIAVVSVEATDWPDASLGCPQEGFMYAQVITPGFLITLEAQGQTFEYHTNLNDQVVLCQP
ncbi:MAG: hypothetical protein Kow0031_21260 [Anaerolineae bacterium]